MGKYNKINKNDVLNVFKTQSYLTKDNIVKELNTSLYQVLPIIDDLIDDREIELVKVKSNYNVPVMKYTLKDNAKQRAINYMKLKSGYKQL